MWRELAQFEKVNYSKLQQRNSLVDLPQPTVQMTIEEAVPADESKSVDLGNSTWLNILAQLKCGRFVQEFAKYLFITKTGIDRINFGLDSGYSHLFDSDYTTKIEFALREFFNNPRITIGIEIFNPIQEVETIEQEPVEAESTVSEEAIVEDEDFSIPPENEIALNPKVMLSTEIAELTGKQHKNVIRDIEVIIEQLEKDGSNLSSGFKSSTYLAGNGKNERCYELDYEATMIVMTGYDVVARAKVIKRWQELEQIAKLDDAPKVEPKPQSSLIENIKATTEIIDATIVLLQRFGIEGNQAALGVNKIATLATAKNVALMVVSWTFELRLQQFERCCIATIKR